MRFLVWFYICLEEVGYSFFYIGERLIYSFLPGGLPVGKKHKTLFLFTFFTFKYLGNFSLSLNFLNKIKHPKVLL